MSTSLTQEQIDAKNKRSIEKRMNKEEKERRKALESSKPSFLSKRTPDEVLKIQTSLKIRLSKIQPTVGGNYMFVEFVKLAAKYDVIEALVRLDKMYSGVESNIGKELFNRCQDYLNIRRIASKR